MLNRTPVGVDIGVHQIKCVTLKKVNDLYYVHHRKTYNTPEGFVAKNGSLDSGWLYSTLADFVREFKIKAPLFCFTLPYSPPLTTIRIFEMPKLSKKELKQSMAYEIEEKILVNSMEEIKYKWSVIEQSENSLRILACAMQSRLVKSLMQAKKALTWKIGAVEPQFLSFARLLKERNSAVIDFGRESTRVMVYKGSVPACVQVIDTGGEAVTSKIQERCNCSWHEAEELKKNKGAVLIGSEEIESGASEKEIAAAVSGPVKKTAQELKQFLRTFEVKEGITVEEIYYTGGGGRLKYLAEYLSTQLGRDLRPLLLSSDSTGPDADDYPYAAAAGAWLRGKYPLLPEINLAKTGSRLPGIDLKAVSAAACAFCIALSVFTFGLHQLADARLEKVQTKCSELQKKINVLQKDREKYNREISKYRNLVKLIEEINDKTFNISDVFLELPYRVTENIMLDRIFVDSRKKQAVLAGKSLTYSDVGFFAIALEDMGEVKVGAVSGQEGGPGYSFEILLDIRPSGN